MTGKRRGPVGLGYMPKGGASAARVSNEQWRRDREASGHAARAVVAVEPGPGARERARFRLPDTASAARLGLLAGSAALLADLVIVLTR